MVFILIHINFYYNYSFYIHIKFNYLVRTKKIVFKFNKKEQERKIMYKQRLYSAFQLYQNIIRKFYFFIQRSSPSAQVS